MSKQQNKRALLAIRKLKRARDEQAGKIDILCNDIVSAHGDFVRQLDNLGFGVKFYESLLGESDTSGILGTAA
ncbi:MAG: hypothetical protein ACYSWP_19095, partial [Planctomycetota bacterium]